MSYPKPVWMPAIPLRFVEREGKKILQQAWTHMGYVEGRGWEPIGHAGVRWKDVPLMEPESNGVWVDYADI